MEQIKNKVEPKLVVKEPPIYVITFYNNDRTTMEGVVLVLEKIFNYTYEIAIPLMMEIHAQGKADIFEGPHDLATQLSQYAINYAITAPEILGLCYLRIELREK